MGLFTGDEVGFSWAYSAFSVFVRILLANLTFWSSKLSWIDGVDVVGADGFDSEPRVRLLCAHCYTAIWTCAACKESSRSVFILTGLFPLFGALHSELRRTN